MFLSQTWLLIFFDISIFDTRFTTKARAKLPRYLFGFENNGHESEADGVEFEVILDGSRSVRVMIKKTRDADFDEAVDAPALSRRQSTREMKKPDDLAFSAKTNEKNGSRDDTLAADNEQNILT